MMIRVVRPRGVDAARPSECLIRGIASPITGIFGASNSCIVVDGSASDSGFVTDSIVGIAVGTMAGAGVDMGSGV